MAGSTLSAVVAVANQTGFVDRTALVGTTYVYRPRHAYEENVMKSRPPAWRTLALTSVAVFVVSLDGTILFVAFPAIREMFADVSAAQLSWVLGAGRVAPSRMREDVEEDEHGGEVNPERPRVSRRVAECPQDDRAQRTVGRGDRESVLPRRESLGSVEGDPVRIREHAEWIEPSQAPAARAPRGA